MKKILITILCFLSLSFTFTGGKTIVHAQEIEPKNNTFTVSNENKTDLTVAPKIEISEGLSAIEQELYFNKTDVVTELEKQINYYQNMLSDTNSHDKITQIENLIFTTQDLITEYQKYQNNIQTRGSFHAIYTPAVATVIAYFNSNNYNLAAELLTHARDNENLDSIYIPINSDTVLNSSVYQNIREGTIIEGTNVFPNKGNTNDQDLYYAIHGFYFSKSASGRVVVIQDRYDYAQTNDYSSLGGIAVDMMYDAQEAGVLVPYYSVITHNFNGEISNPTETINIPSNMKYYEDKVTLGKGEYKDYHITFNSNGSKVIQTFGSQDTYLYLYNSNGSLIAYNDDGGYSLNAFIRYDCLANVQYTIRVKFFSSILSGETKLAITPSYDDANNDCSITNAYDDIFNVSGSAFNYSTFSTSGYVSLLTYTAPKTAYYTIETTGSVDTYLYIIDPRSTYLLSSSDYNDDSGEGFNAKLNKELAKNIPYLIIYSKWNLAGANENFHLAIYQS